MTALGRLAQNIRRVHLRALARDGLTQFLAGVAFASAVFSWAMWGYIMTVPPRTELFSSSGSLTFERSPNGRGGDYTVLISDQSERLVFGCDGGARLDRDCVRRSDQHLYSGKPALVRWFWSRTSTGGRAPKLVELTVDGNAVIRYDPMAELYNKTPPLLAMTLLIFLLAGLGVVLVPLRRNLNLEPSA